MGTELDVDHEILRGSGIPANRWLTWCLGLRTAPSTRYFALMDSEGTLAVNRGTSDSQLSSLRAVAQALEVVRGCKIAVLLHLDTDTATTRRTCPAGASPAMKQREAPTKSCYQPTTHSSLERVGSVRAWQTAQATHPRPDPVGPRWVTPFWRLRFATGRGCLSRTGVRPLHLGPFARLVVGRERQLVAGLVRCPQYGDCVASVEGAGEVVAWLTFGRGS